MIGAAMRPDATITVANFLDDYFLSFLSGVVFVITNSIGVLNL